MKTSFRISLTIGLLVVANFIQAQDNPKKVIQFTGVIFAQDSLSVIPGVHVYTPKGGRGTTTNPYGFFSMPALEGDSVIFSTVGFERTYYIVPKHEGDHSLKLLVYLEEDVQFLEEVEIFPYPSEAAFKAAVLAAVPPGQEQRDQIDRWLSTEFMRTAYLDLPNSPNMNHRFFMDQQMDNQVYRLQGRQNPLLNPFAWANFIKSLRNR